MSILQRTWKAFRPSGPTPPWLESVLTSIDRKMADVERMAEYTVATAPDPAGHPREWIYVTDESGGATPAFSDGTNWRRTSDRAIIS